MAKKAEAVKVNAAQTSVYTVDELVAAAGNIFGGGVLPECVEAAFALNGKKEATIEEAKEIVSKFMRREIK